jgi:hypothetical protein
MGRDSLTQERLKELLRYEPLTGLLFWRAPNHRQAKGAIGCPTKGYLCVWVNGHYYALHRLAWLYMCGSFPEKLVDHINGDRTDNRWDNLREVTHAQNLQGARKSRTDSKTGILGVCTDRRYPGRFSAFITRHRVRTYLGTFSCPIEAGAAYAAAKAAYA